MKKGILTMVLILGIAAAFASLACAGGLSMGPVKINLIGITTGKEYYVMVFILNSFEDDAPILLRTEGECQNWTRFYDEINSTINMSRIIVPALGKKNIYTRFNVPANAPLGDYECRIYAQQDVNTEEGQQSFVIRLKSIVRVSVLGTQILTGEVRGMEIPNINQSDTFFMNVYFENTGNAYEMPVFEIKIEKNGNLIDNFSYSGSNIRPGSTEKVEIQRANSYEPGIYNATLKVTLNGTVLFERDYLEFRVYAKENINQTADAKTTSNSENNITNITETKPVTISAPESISEGSIAKIDLVFTNRENYEVSAKASGEVYLNGELVEILETDSFYLMGGETKKITEYFKPEKTGEYSINFTATYGQESIILDEIKISVLGAEQSPSPTGMDIMVPAGGAAVGIAAMVVIYLFLKSRKSSRAQVKKDLENIRV